MAVNKVQKSSGEVIIDISDSTVTSEHLAEGYTAYDKSGAKITGSMTSGAAIIRDEIDSHGGTVRHITTGETVEGTKSITSNGVVDVGNYAYANVNVQSATPSLQVKSATPSETAQIITPDSSYDGLSQVNVGAISSTYVGSGITRQAAKTVTPSTSSQTAVASGRYTTGAITVAAMPSGTAGTPKATKGTVSNNSVSVTPSVTNSTGYITGSTKTGTAITVSASELVSGNKSITENGTGIDVTNYSTVSVDVSSGGGLQIGTFTVNSNFDGSGSYYVGFIDYYNNQFFVPIKTYSGEQSVTGHGLINTDGFIYVTFTTASLSQFPRVTATSGTATLFKSFTNSSSIVGLYTASMSGAVYKLSPGAVATLTYFNNN